MYFLNQERSKAKIIVPSVLQAESLVTKPIPRSQRLSDDVKSYFPHLSHAEVVELAQGGKSAGGPLNVGVVFSGGQAPGGHNVIAGLFDALKRLHKDSRLIGFLGGPAGIINNIHRELNHQDVDRVRNQGGFDLIGSGRTKIEKPEDFEKAKKSCLELHLDGLVIVGGDDSNTNAALLAEYFLANGCSTSVVGVPKTIDGDLKSEMIEASFGFDTAAKTFATSIGALLRDALSAKKYTFFIKLMGRTASHLTLECALETHPNMAIIGEEAAASGKTLGEIVDEIVQLVAKRSQLGKDYGAILIPEGLIEFIPEFRELIDELNLQMADEASHEQILERLSHRAKSLFLALPSPMQQQLLEERDPHGNVQVSKIETERLLIELVGRKLEEKKARGDFKGKFAPVPLFFGYEGRSCLPSCFDANYCYALGMTAASLLREKRTGYIACIRNLASPPSEWQAFGVPLPSLITLEMRKGKRKPVIKKALVDLSGQPFLFFKERRSHWATEDDYHYPGPIQFYGPEEIVNETTLTLKLELAKEPRYVM
ncbi:diphosphate--fructose-6-phosphate 1-phosphotransferase [Estrella lausannensis]|uniref:Pyrophosphate--fructose 6-phosphate 1-phosphotransferase n=1 Tax=Estrella lausannensis TaxID=483423 RepID=A0A0H5DQ40_9BACT|nr:diphosphate--fructose-6-phosphate 1-phosphotransferase [Estrella lausannensis]CRX38163.1 Pyrophosphate--fructose 6-phosphate 1-phosphotransferase [Estrella lausannensis]